MFVKFSRRVKFLLIFIYFLSLTSTAQAATTYYVNDTNGSDDNNDNGTESTPFKTITKALTKADDDDTIIVSSGTYQENTLTIGKSFTLKSSGAVTLDGDNAHSVIKITGVTPTIEGFTIKNGKNDSMGGGILVDNSYTLTVKNCRFESNAADMGGAINHNGNGSRSLIIENCTFVSNTATGNSGGAVDSHAGTMKITNCTFTNNKLSGNDPKGDGVYLATGTNTINYCTFVNNTATTGGAIYKDTGYGGTVTVENSIIHGSVSGVTPEATSCITLTSAQTTESAQDKDKKVTHTVFRKYSELSAAVNKGNDDTVTVDQLKQCNRQA